jgi:hypothetical protein
MIPLHSETDYLQAKCHDRLPVECEHCGRYFLLPKNIVQKALRGVQKSDRAKYCSVKCTGLAAMQGKEVPCTNCGTLTYRARKALLKQQNHFCKQGCAASYNNKNKQTGTRRSKLEAWIEGELVKIHPSLEIHFNRKDAINSELDIYIPSLKLAFELNGIFHYEPIYGANKLKCIRTNDSRKFQACLERGIELAIIDTSTLLYFKPSKAQRFLDIIESIIAQNEARRTAIPKPPASIG